MPSLRPALMSWGRRWGAVQSLQLAKASNPTASHSQKKSGMEKQSSSTGWGGRREGAGRPLGSRNKPRLIHGLPETADPLQWLLAAMNHPDLTLRQRVKIASTLMPYCHPPG